jgi:hypothetical protein
MLFGQYLGRVTEVPDQFDCLQSNACTGNSAFEQTPVQFWFSQVCSVYGLPPDGLVPSQRMNLCSLLLVKGPIRQGYQAAWHLHSQMRLGDVLRRIRKS